MSPYSINSFSSYFYSYVLVRPTHFFLLFLFFFLNCLFIQTNSLLLALPSIFSSFSVETWNSACQNPFNPLIHLTFFQSICLTSHSVNNLLVKQVLDTWSLLNLSASTYLCPAQPTGHLVSAFWLRAPSSQWQISNTLAATRFCSLVCSLPFSHRLDQLDLGPDPLPVLLHVLIEILLLTVPPPLFLFQSCQMPFWKWLLLAEERGATISCAEGQLSCLLLFVKQL